MDLGRVLLMRGEYLRRNTMLASSTRLRQQSAYSSLPCGSADSTEQGRFDIAAQELDGIEEGIPVKSARPRGCMRPLNRIGGLYLAQGKLRGRRALVPHQRGTHVLPRTQAESRFRPRGLAATLQSAAQSPRPWNTPESCLEGDRVSRHARRNARRESRDPHVARRRPDARRPTAASATAPGER